MMSSATVPLQNIPGIVKAIPGSGENCSPSPRNRCSPSARNPVRLHPGILFTFTPESFSPSPGIRTVGIEEPDDAFGLLKRLDQSIQKQPVETTIGEANASLVMFEKC